MEVLVLEVVWRCWSWRWCGGAGLGGEEDGHPVEEFHLGVFGQRADKALGINIYQKS